MRHNFDLKNSCEFLKVVPISVRPGGKHIVAALGGESELV